MSKSRKKRKAARPKHRLTVAQRRARRERKRKFQAIYINGQRKWVRRPPLIGGLPVDEFIANNADPLWLHQSELWERTGRAESDAMSEVLAQKCECLTGDLNRLLDEPHHATDEAPGDDDVPF